MHELDDVHETAASPLMIAVAGAGTGTTFHELPFHASAMECQVLALVLDW